MKYRSFNDLAKKDYWKIYKLIKYQKGGNDLILRKKSGALFFTLPSTRTRLSFEIAMKELGIRTVSLSLTDTQMIRGESIMETMGVLNCYCDIIVIRDLGELAFYRKGKAHLINALSKKNHPTQVGSDLFTLLENEGSALYRKNILYIGAENNISKSWYDAARMFHLRLKSFDIHRECIKRYKQLLYNSDILITDVFHSMGDQEDDDEHNKSNGKYKRYRIRKRYLDQGRKLMHCMPCKDEIEKGVIYHHNSLVWHGVANKRFFNKALIYGLLK
ncbi:ornithine carbamoyltransferase [Candidatus Vidania fulgoroideorum]